MLVRRVLGGLSFAASISWSGLAGAQYFHADPTVRVTAGYTFNRIIPDDPSLPQADQSSPLVSLAPSLALSYETPLVTHKLTLAGTLGLPLSSDFTFNGLPPNYSFRGNYSGVIPLGPLTKLTLAGMASAAPINGYSTLQDPSLTPIDAPPADLSYNFTLSGTATLRRELTEESSLTSTSNVHYTFPFNVTPIRPSTLSVKNSLALTRKWTRDTLTLTGSVNVTRFGPSETQGVDPRVQVINDLVLMWKRPFTESLTGTLRLGVSQTISPQSTVGQVWAPTGSATLLYILEPASITLMYSYASVVDVYTATTNLNNQASLRVVMPLSTTGLALSGSGGVVHTVPIGDVGVGLNSVTSDVGLTYTPLDIPKFSVSLRGVYAHQVAIDNPLTGITRVGAIFNVAFSYPNTASVDVALRATPSFIPTTNFEGDVALGQEVPATDFAPRADGPADVAPPAAPPEPAPPPAAAP